MAALVPVLAPEWVHPPMAQTTADGQAIVELVVSSPLSWDDLLRISITANSRFKLGQLAPDAAAARVIELEKVIAGFKLATYQAQKDSIQARLERDEARAELAVARETLAGIRGDKSHQIHHGTDVPHPATKVPTL